MSSIKWNPKVELILSDVDETVADLYLPAKPEMIKQLSKLLEKGVVLFFITGQGVESVQKRITDKLNKSLRKNILISHCSGAEVWGFSAEGELNIKPFYSLYDEKLTKRQKKSFRVAVKQIISEFRLNIYPTMPVVKFKKISKSEPLDIMYEDRGPQITFEVVNGYDLPDEQLKNIKHSIPETHGHYDLRISIHERAEKIFKSFKLPITPRLGGMFAIDFAIEGVSKTTSVKYIIKNDKILESIGLTREEMKNPNKIEIWGDKFSTLRGGTDRHMSEAVNKRVRSIDFRDEDPDEFLTGYNTVLWDGKRHLHEGLLEYLKTSN